MPLYEYECQSCGHRFERIQKFKAPPVRKCPQCKKGKVRKLPSAPAVQFKGSGWYITDYQRKGTSSTLPDRGEGSKEKGEQDSGKKEAAKDVAAADGDASKKTGKKD